MFVAVVGLVRGHDLVGLAGEHGEVLAGFSLALFEGLFGRRCIGGGGVIGWFRRRISGDGRGSASAELSGSSFLELILQRQMAWDFLNKALKVEHGSGAGWLSNALTENV